MSEKIFPSAWLIEAMKKKPLWEDNVKVDQSRVNRLIMVAKVSLLLLWSALTGKIASYLKSSGKPHNNIWGDPKIESQTDAQRMIFDLPHPLDVVDEKTGIQLDTPAEEYYIAPSPDAPDEYNQRGPIRLFFRLMPQLIHPNANAGCRRNSYNLMCNMVTACRDKLLREVSLYEFFNPITPNKSIPQTCHFFGVSPAPYAPYNKAVGMICESFTPSYDDEEYWEDLKKQNPHISETVMIERQLRAILDHDPDVVFREILSKVSEGFHRQVFTFNDADGFPIMKVVKLMNYDLGRGLTKSYIPIVQMRQAGKPDSQYETLPLPDKQILFNLDKISNAEIIVVCSNFEIADYLQSVNSRGDIAFTAFLSDDLEHVDFSPLKDKEVWLLVVNHSGLSLAEAYINSEKLYNYLTDKGKQKELNAVQAEIKYADIPSEIKTLHEYMDFRRSHARASITPGSIIEMTTREEFDTALETAKREAARKVAASQDQQFWAPEENNTETASIPVDTKKNEHLFYPFIARGAISYIAGESGIGKSNLIASIAACIVNISQRRPEIFPERCWSGCKVNNGYDRLKILHLDYESGRGGIKKREMDFVDSYLPDDKTERQLCKDNYIVEDLSTDSTNYAEESHFEDLCRLIESKANEGIQGQPVDILIIDTFQSFVHERDCDHWVLKKLLDRYPNLAIVVLHHLENGKFVGLKAKKRIAQATVYLTRDKEDEKKTVPAHTPNMHDPFKVEIENLKLPHAQEDEEVFVAKFDEHNRFVVIDPIRSKAQMIRRIQDSLGYDKEKLASLLGMGEEKLNKYLSEAKKEGKKKA